MPPTNFFGLRHYLCLLHIVRPGLTRTTHKRRSYARPNDEIPLCSHDKDVTMIVSFLC